MKKRTKHGICIAAKKTAPFDAGKAQALRDAGWSINMIAIEMDTNPERIEAITHEPAPRKRYENEWRTEEPGFVKSPDLI